MVLVLLTGEYPPQPGGIGDYTSQLAAALRARGHTVAVITIQHGALRVYDPEPAPVELAGDRPLFATPLDWTPRCWPAVIAALDRLRPQWLHIQYQTGAYAMAPGINLLPWRLRGIKGAGGPRIAVTFHDLLVPYLFPKAGPARQWINVRLAEDADAVVVTNRADAAGLQRLTVRQAPSSPSIIPIGSNIPVAPPADYNRAAWRAGLGVAPDELLVAYFGLLSPSKGADVLAAALTRLLTPWRLLLVGGAATAPQDVAHAELVHARLAALGLTARVITTGHVAATEVSAHLMAADCAALPFRDGASFRRGSLLAALAHGCPVVTTEPADPADDVLLAPAALLVQPGDPGALGTALNRLAGEPDLRAALAAAGPTLAAHFTWDTIAARHEEIYRQIVL